MSDQNLLEDEVVPTSYSSSTPAAATNRPAVKAPGAGTGRRKEAVARVYLSKGEGKITVNEKEINSGPVYDLLLNPNELNGMKKVSLIRLTKLATIDTTLVEGRLGKLNSSELEQVNNGLIQVLK